MNLKDEYMRLNTKLTEVNSIIDELEEDNGAPETLHDRKSAAFIQCKAIELRMHNIFQQLKSQAVGTL